MTKHDILSSGGRNFSSDDSFYDDISEAMDIYAKQEAIAFAEWIDKNCVTSYNTDDKYFLDVFLEEGWEYTRLELYELYQQSQTKK